MRVLALTRYDHMGASSRVRFLQYIPLLERMGLQIDVQHLFSNESLTRLYVDGRRSPAELVGALVRRIATVLDRSRADVVWLQQELFPFLPETAEAALLSRRPFVIDLDDAYQLYYQAHRSGIARKLYGDKIAGLLRRANAVTVGNPNLAAYARESGAANVHLVYSAVDTTRFAEIASAGPPVDFCVGWVGTPMTAAQSLHILHDPLRQFLTETGAKALFLGMAAEQFPDLPGRRIPWSEAAEPPFLAALSAGLCPLEDSPWTRGKSGYKIIQYMSAGRPALTSPVAIAADLVEPGTTGFHCRTPEDWYGALNELYRSADLTAAMGRTARSRAENRTDTRLAAEQLHGILTA